MNLTYKLLAAHLVSGELVPGREIALRIDQTLTQDATGTMAYLQFERMGADKVRTELSVSYVDHNTVQVGFENAMTVPRDTANLAGAKALSVTSICISPPLKTKLTLGSTEPVK